MVITKGGNNNVKNFVSENSETNTLKMLLKRLNERLNEFSLQFLVYSFQYLLAKNNDKLHYSLLGPFYAFVLRIFCKVGNV